MKEFLKKAWKYILGFIGFFAGLVWFLNSNTNRKVEKLKDQIKDNEGDTKVIKKELERTLKAKGRIKKDIKSTDEKLKKVNNKKPKIKRKTGKQAADDLKKRLK
jgi:septal ring factor EnvC (AmiA/AmiB activator)